MLYGLHQYAKEQLDALVEAKSCIGVCIRQCDWRWCGELHIVGVHGIKSVVLALVSGGAGWEKRMLNNVIAVLASLKDRIQLKTIAVEGDVHVGRALAAVVSPKTPLVVGFITQRSVFDEVQKQFLAEFAGLDPLSVLEYFRVRLMSVAQEGFLDRMPLLRRVSEKTFFCVGHGICVGLRLFGSGEKVDCVLVL